MALFALCALFLLLATHPFITFPLSLYIMRSWRREPLRPVAGHEESYAICVCAYNEEASIQAKAENLLALKQVFPNLEILIYVDAATDRTAEILEKYKNDFNLHISPERHGKSYGMGLLVAKAKSSVIIFSDANVMLDIDSMRALPKYFADPSVGCVCGHLKYINENETVTAQTGSIYWRLEEFIKSAESDTGSVMGADGSIFAVRRALYQAPPAHIIDDMFVSFSILCNGYRIVRAPDVIAYEKSVTSPREEFKRKIRIACQALNVHRLLWPKLRTLDAFNLYKYISHKLLRWMVIYWLLLAAICFEAGMATNDYGTTGLILLLLGSVALGIGAYKRLPVATQLADILGAFTATGIGVWRSFTGETFQTWSPATSIRE